MLLNSESHSDLPNNQSSCGYSLNFQRNARLSRKLIHTKWLESFRGHWKHIRGIKVKILRMPKRTRDQDHKSLQMVSESLDDVDVDEMGHTPKWTRSSTSTSPSPSEASAQKAVHHRDTKEMQCILPGHPLLTLASAAEFEIHYAKEHDNQCIKCKSNLPSPWLLELHQDENHDPLIAARRNKDEKVYRCFLQDCEKVTHTPQKRRLHLIDKHGFPKDYDFRIVDSGFRGKNSLLRDQNQTTPQHRRRISDVGKPGWRDRLSLNPRQHPVSDGKSGSDHVIDHERKKDSGENVPPIVNAKHQDNLDPTTCSEIDPVETLSKSLSSLSFVPMSIRMKNKKKG